MGRTGIRAACAAILGAGLATISTAATTTAATAGSRSPTLSASKHAAGLPAVTEGQSIKLSGDASHGGVKTVVLQANTFPFLTGFHTFAHEQTHGRYAFTMKPRRATQYRAVVEGTPVLSSRALTVYVLPRGMTTSCNLCSLNNSSGAHVLVVTGQLRPASGTGPVYFYYGQANGSTVAPNALPLVKTVPPQVSAGGISFTVTYRVHFPSGPSRFRYTYCRQNDEAHDGFGLPGHHHCGDPRVSIRDYLG